MIFINKLDEQQVLIAEEINFEIKLKIKFIQITKLVSQINLIIQRCNIYKQVG